MMGPSPRRRPAGRPIHIIPSVFPRPVAHSFELRSRLRSCFVDGMAPPILFPYSLSTTAAPSPASTCPRRGSSSTVASLISKSPVSCEKVGSSRDSTAADGAATEFVTVTWDGPDDPQNPKNWSKGKKWAVRIIHLHQVFSLSLYQLTTSG